MVRTKLIRIMQKPVCLILTIVMIISLLVGCGNNWTSKRPYRSINGSVIETQLLASNDEYKLSWDAEANAILFESISTGKIWSDILYDAYLEGSTSANGNSPISITVADNDTLKWDTIKSYSALLDGGKIVTKKIENGIRVTYFFDKYEIAVPIDYQLRNDSLAVTILTDQILESGTAYKLVSVQLTPMLCSVSNQTEGAYLFTPTGSGAIMYAANTPEGTRNYIGEIYGDDYGRQKPENFTDKKSVQLPIFAAKEGSTAIMGIVEQGAGSAFIEAQTSNERLGYSYIGATAYVRGYDEYSYSSFATGYTILKDVADDLVTSRTTVAFYPLFGEDADYNGMAEKYRNYLLEKGMLEKSDVSTSPYSVTLLGGTNVTVSTLGIPNTKLVAMTKYNEAEKIVSELTADNGISPIVRMMGYGDGGIKPKTVGGGKNLPSVFGTKKELAQLQKICKDSNTTLFMDFDIVRYSKSGNGFSYKADSAYTTIGSMAKHNYVSPLRVSTNEEYAVLSRVNLGNAIDKVIKKSNKYNFNAVSLSTLGTMAYSDYSDVKYHLRGGIENDVSAMITKLSDSDYVTAVSGANSYVAGVSDMLFDVSVHSGNDTSFDVDIPFYQMVFHSYKPMYTDAVNLSGNSSQMISRAAASGMGLGFTITYRYVDNSNDLTTEKLYGMVYQDVKDDINSILSNGFSENYSNLCNALFDRYELINNSISKSHFSNGVSVYVNHTGESVESPVGQIGPYDCIYVKEGE